MDSITKLLFWVVVFAFFFVATTRGASIEKNGIEVNLLENQRDSPVSGFAVLNITAKKNYDFKTTDLTLSWKKKDYKKPEKGVFADPASEVNFQWLEQVNQSFVNSRSVWVNNYSLIVNGSPKVFENFTTVSWTDGRLAWVELTDKTQIKLKKGESIVLKLVGTNLNPSHAYDWIARLQNDLFEEFAWWDVNWLYYKDVNYTTANWATNLNWFPVEFNATGLKLGSNNCANEIRVTQVSGANEIELPSGATDSAGQALGDGNEFCGVVAIANMTANATTNLRVYYGNSGAAYKDYSTVGYNFTWINGTNLDVTNEWFDLARVKWNKGSALTDLTLKSVQLMTYNSQASLWSLVGSGSDSFNEAVVSTVVLFNTSVSMKLGMFSATTSVNLTFYAKAPVMKLEAKPTQGAARFYYQSTGGAPQPAGATYYANNGWFTDAPATSNTLVGKGIYVGNNSDNKKMFHVWNASLDNNVRINSVSWNQPFYDGTTNKIPQNTLTPAFFGASTTAGYADELAWYLGLVYPPSLTLGSEVSQVTDSSPTVTISAPANNTVQASLTLNVTYTPVDGQGFNGVNASILFTNHSGFKGMIGNQSPLLNNTALYLWLDFPAATEATFLYTIQVSDNATTTQRANATIRQVTIDAVNPSSVSFVSPTTANNTASNAAQTFNFTFTESRPSTCIFSWNNTVNSTPTTAINVGANSWSCNAVNSTMVQGRTHVVAYVNDTAGNWNSTVARTVIFDNVAPTVGAITVSPPNATNFNSSINFTIRSTITETTSGLQSILAQVDSVNYTAWNDGTQYRYALNNVLSVSPYHHYSFYAQDNAGNWAWSGNNTWDLERGVLGGNLSIDGLELNRTKAYTSGNTNLSLIANITSGVSWSIYQNGTLAFTGTDFIAPTYSWAGGAYRFVGNASQTGNWTSNSTWERLLIIDRASPGLNVFFNGTGVANRTYDSTTGGRVNATLNYSATEATATFFVNGSVQASNVNFTDYAVNQVSTWNFSANYSSNANFTYEYIERYAFIYPSPTPAPGGGGGGGGARSTPTPTAKPISAPPVDPQKFFVPFMVFAGVLGGLLLLRSKKIA